MWRWFSNLFRSNSDSLASDADEVVLIFATAADEDQAEDVCARLLLSNVVAMACHWPGMKSLTNWGDETHEVNEVGMIFLTRASLADRAIERAKAMYSYDTPTFVVLDIKGGHAPFLQYIRGRTSYAK